MRALLLPLTLTAPLLAAQEALDEPQQRLGVELAAEAPSVKVTFEELDELLLARHGRSPLGKETLGSLVQLRVVEHLAAEGGVEVSQAELNARWRALDEQVRMSGQYSDLDAYLQDQGVSRTTFKEHLELALLHEKLARAGLGLGPEDALSGEQQEAWLRARIGEFELEEGTWPWIEAPVVRAGPVVIDRNDFAAYLRQNLPDDELRDACYEMLLVQRMEARMPDLSAETYGSLVEAEITRRRTELESSGRFGDATYEQLLDAQGLSLEVVRMDPAVRTAALAHGFIDRAHDEDALRSTYAEERVYFDSLHGAGWQVSIISLNAASVPNELVKRTFEEAEQELEQLRDRAGEAKAFAILAEQVSEDKTTRERKGYFGVVTRESKIIPPGLRDAVWAVVDQVAEQDGRSPEGQLVGPLRLGGSVILGRIGAERPAPTWEEMRAHVHRELRRRLLQELLPRGSASCWLDL